MSYTARRYVLLFGSCAVAATLVPSGLTVSELKLLPRSGNFPATRAVATSQIRSFRYCVLPVTAKFRRAEGQVHHEFGGWGKVAHGSPVAASHKRTVPSQLPEASQRPSGL